MPVSVATSVPLGQRRFWHTTWRHASTRCVTSHCSVCNFSSSSLCKSITDTAEDAVLVHLPRWHYNMKGRTKWQQYLTAVCNTIPQGLRSPEPAWNKQPFMSRLNFKILLALQTLPWLSFCLFTECNETFLCLFVTTGSPTFSYPTTPTNNTPPQQPRLQVKAGEILLSSSHPHKKNLIYPEFRDQYCISKQSVSSIQASAKFQIDFRIFPKFNYQ